MLSVLVWGRSQNVAAATIRKTTHEERVLSAKPCLSLLLSAPFETQCRVRRQGEINEEQCTNPPMVSTDRLPSNTLVAYRLRPQPSFVVYSVLLCTAGSLRFYGTFSRSSAVAPTEMTSMSLKQSQMRSVSASGLQTKARAG